MKLERLIIRRFPAVSGPACSPDEGSLVIHLSPDVILLRSGIGFKSPRWQRMAWLHCKVAPADIFIFGKASRILVMHDLSLVDDEGLLGDPQAEMQVLLGEQDGGAARSQLPQHLADGGDHDRR